MVYTKDQLDVIWNKGIAVDGYDSNIIRKDACGAWIVRSHYGSEESDYSWEVDHICPVSFLKEKGVDDSLINDITNLRPLNRKNNISKSSNYPNYIAATTAIGEENYDRETSFTVKREVQAELNAFFNLSLL